MPGLKSIGPPEQFYDDLRSLPSRLKVAWHEAKAFPDRDEAILDEVVREARRVTGVAIMRLREWADAAEMRGNARERAVDQAERHIEAVIAQAQVTALTDSISPHGFYVYCLWGADDITPLYIGRSENILARLGAHMSNIDRRHRVQRVTLTRCSTFSKMCAIEARMIRQYQPPLNILGIVGA